MSLAHRKLAGKSRETHNYVEDQFRERSEVCLMLDLVEFKQDEQERMLDTSAAEFNVFNYMMKKRKTQTFTPQKERKIDAKRSLTSYKS